MLKIYNSKTKQKEVFNPIIPQQVGLYVCGITVYDDCHIGHARTFLAFDAVVRYLRYRGYKVKFVRNITDIDDKIIQRAQEQACSTKALTQRFIERMHEDMQALNLVRPDQEPRATEFMPEMIHLIEQLMAKDYAYVGTNGDVFYAVRKLESYGSLSKRNIDDMQVGARIDSNPAKRDPLDFVLWKKAKPGEPAWESPWGAGRPGWHLECSAMSMKLLGETFDIHGGGYDLLFPHHENECAQSEAVTGKTFVNYWMHAGFLQIDKEKMSKSLGNFLTIREALQTVHPEVLRFFMISGHYRHPLDYSLEKVKQSRQAVERLYTAIRDVEMAEVSEPGTTSYGKRFVEAMDDDFNTPEALAVLFDLAREINRQRQSDGAQVAELAGLLKHLGNSLGLLSHSANEFLQSASGTETELDQLSAEAIEQLIQDRKQARVDKQWQRADEIRDQLTQNGVQLEDTPTGTIWRRES